MYIDEKTNVTHYEAADTRRYWLLFLVFFVIFALMLIFMNQWFWVAMPFMLTFLVLALGYM